MPSSAHHGMCTPLPRSLAALVLVLIGTFSGCGGVSPDRPPMGYVSGSVTMDGKPVENVFVVMKPESGRMAMVKTDKNGFYDIEYTEGEKGTKQGPTTVHLEWPTGFAGPFRIPPKFATGNKEIRLDVKSGKQTFDITMESEAGKAGQKPVMVD